MRVNVVIHSIDSLDADQLAKLTMLLMVTFGTGVSVNTDKHTATVSLVTNDVQVVFRTIEALTPRLATSYHPDLWTSVSIES